MLQSADYCWWPRLGAASLGPRGTLHARLWRAERRQAVRHSSGQLKTNSESLRYD